jgi:hypothetical protein
VDHHHHWGLGGKPVKFPRQPVPVEEKAACACIGANRTGIVCHGLMSLLLLVFLSMPRCRNGGVTQK